MADAMEAGLDQVDTLKGACESELRYWLTMREITTVGQKLPGNGPCLMEIDANDFCRVATERIEMLQRAMKAEGHDTDDVKPLTFRPRMPPGPGASKARN